MMAPPFDLSNRVALVTGSSRGLGLAIAQGLAAAGARVILHGRDQARLSQQAAALPNAAGTLAFDVTDAAAVRAAFGGIEAEHGRLDILVNNAGVIPRKPLLETTDEDWQSVIDLNLDRLFPPGAGGGTADGAAQVRPYHHGALIMGLLGRANIPGYSR